MKRTRHPFIWSGLLGLLAGSLSLPAASTDPELLPYLVVATRTPLGLERVSPSASYIGAEEMEFWQDRSLIDVLQREPGMAIGLNGTPGSTASLFTRGTESNHTAIFLDGRRLNPGFGRQYGIATLPVQNLGSVQILRGASSVNYGSSGIGGVVDLRTRSGFDRERPGGSVEVESGPNAFRRAAVEASAASGPFAFSLDGSSLRTDNERPNDDFELDSISSRVDLKLAENLTFELVGHYTDAFKGVPGDVVTPSLTDEQDTTEWLLSPGLRFGTDSLSVHLFYARSESELAIRDGFPASSRVVADEVNLQLDYSLDGGALLTVGSVYRNDEAQREAGFGGLDENFGQVGVFGQLLWPVSERLELRAGLRFDDYTDFDEQVTGNVEAQYRLGDCGLTLFGKIASSFAPPGAADIAFDGDPTGTPIEPEESLSYELGFRHTMLEGDFVWSVLAFRNEIDDLLGFVFVPPFTFDTINVDEATTEGVEVAADYRLSESISLGLGYTYLTATNDDSDERLSRRPRHLLQLSADFKLTARLRAGLSAVGYFDREDFIPAPPPTFGGNGDHEDFLVVRLVADWELDQHWTVFARVENLLDESYEPNAGYPALGRSGYLGARFSF